MWFRYSPPPGRGGGAQGEDPSLVKSLRFRAWRWRVCFAIVASFLAGLDVAMVRHYRRELFLGSLFCAYDRLVEFTGAVVIGSPAGPASAVCPRVRHAIWFFGDQVPASAQRAFDLVKRRNPHWEHRLWTPDDVAAELAGFDAAAGAAVSEALARLHPEQHAAISDVLRYAIVLKHGGLYMDIKARTEAPLDDLFGCSEPTLVYSSIRGTRVEAGCPGLAQWGFYSSPGHSVLRRLVQDVVAAVADPAKCQEKLCGKPAVLRLTGPRPFNDVLCNVFAAAEPLAGHSVAVAGPGDLARQCRRGAGVLCRMESDFGGALVYNGARIYHLEMGAMHYSKRSHVPVLHCGRPCETHTHSSARGQR